MNRVREITVTVTEPLLWYTAKERAVGGPDGPSCPVTLFGEGALDRSREYVRGFLGDFKQHLNCAFKLH